MYAKGESVEQNYVEAVKLYRKAAEQGLALGQHNLGLMYNLGEGVPQDDVQAYAWFNIAAAQGQPACQGKQGAYR